MDLDASQIQLDPRIRHLAKLCGLIRKEGERDVLNTDWFSDPLHSLRALPSNKYQRDALVDLLAAMWPKEMVSSSPVLDADGKPEKRLAWLKVPRPPPKNSGQKGSGGGGEKKREERGEKKGEPPGRLFVVTEKTDQAVSLGLGLSYRYDPQEKKGTGKGNEGAQRSLSGQVAAKAPSQLTIKPFAYFPLAGMPRQSGDYFVLGTQSNPLYLGLDVHIRGKSTLEKLPAKLAPYDGLRIFSGFVFRPGSETPSFRAYARKKAPKDEKGKEPEFQLLTAPDFPDFREILELFLKFFLALPDFRDFLRFNLSLPKFPDLEINFLALLQKLIPNFSLPDFDLSLPDIHLRLPDIELPRFPDLEIDFDKLLQALLDLRIPSFPLPGLPDISLNFEQAIGIEFQLQDILLWAGSSGAKQESAGKGKQDSESKSKDEKQPYKVLGQLGEAYGDNSPASWVRTKPGVKVLLGRITPSGGFEAAPALELASVGFDIEGLADKPLVDFKGVRLEGVKPRLYLSAGKPGQQGVEWGIAAKFQKIGIPLAPPSGKGGGNPVAQNLLSSGSAGASSAKGSPGGGAAAANPTFSATIGYKDQVWGKIEGDESSDGKVWLAFRRQFGPLFCRRLGFGFEAEGSRLLVGYDGQVAVGPLTLDLVDLSVGIPLRSPTELSAYSLDLQGINIGFDKPPVAISGGLFKTKDPQTGLTEYAGAALIQAQALTISGFGVFGSVAGEPSFFLFAMLDKDLGGPPIFHITGVAAGFGYNRGLKLPAVEDVEQFPLVKGMIQEDYFGGSDDPKQALILLRDYLPARLGAYWLAAGIRFTSFEMVESVALLSASFGAQTVISLLGVSTLAVPKGAKKGEAVAYARLLLKAEIIPEAHSLKLEARLSDDSYILSQDCRLTGGFAFYSWFGGVHDGDFIITVGGYHPRFPIPAHYPKVPRVTIDWRVTGDLRVRGELYFALTPSCLMAGGKMAARFESGGLKAWFDAYADFLMYWEPFRYMIDVGVSIGVSYTFKINLLFCTIRITLKFELSAQLSLWGPSFAGRARLSWGPLDFTLRFGDQSRKVTPLTWGQFAERMLPPRPVTIDVAGGLIRQDKVELEKGMPSVRWPVVNAHELRVTTRSAVPATGIRLAGREASVGSGAQLGIWPMDKRKMTAGLKIELRKFGDPSGSRASAQFESEVLKQNVPFALWSPQPMTALTPSADVIPQAATGLGFRLAKIDPTHQLPPVDLEKLKYEKIHKRIPWRAGLHPPDNLTGVQDALKTTIWGDSKVDGKRAGILAALQQVTPYPLNTVSLPLLKETAEEVYLALPEPANLGQRPRQE